MIDHFGFLAPFYEHFIRPRLPERLLELLDIPVGGKVLDAGGGTGRVAQYLRGRGALVIVADESLKMLREASRKDGVSALQALAERLPFPRDSFDRIVMVDALHHLASQKAAAGELWRLLKPEGRLVIEEPDLRDFSVKVVAVGEKLLLMRSHFLAPDQIAALFQPYTRQVRVEAADHTAWIVVEK